MRKLYADRLVADGVMTAADADQMIAQYRQALDAGRLELHPALGLIGNKYTIDWTRYGKADWSERRGHRRGTGTAGGAGQARGAAIRTS